MIEKFQHDGEVWSIKINEPFKNLGTRFEPNHKNLNLVSFTDTSWKVPDTKLPYAIVLFNAKTNIFERINQTKEKLIPLFTFSECGAPSHQAQQIKIQRVIYAACFHPSCFKTPKIRPEILSLPFSHGGLNIPYYTAYCKGECGKRNAFYPFCRP